MAISAATNAETNAVGNPGVNSVSNLTLVIMGVAGCGKSTVGEALARRLRAKLIEGDDYHPEVNRKKMALGLPLTDADRKPWLQSLALQLGQSTGNVVMTCSALKIAYRQIFRAAVPNCKFVFLALDQSTAHKRVQARESHFFSPALVESQFSALEAPTDEAGVLHVEATQTIDQITHSVMDWINCEKVL